jgi:hypothetical protein
MKASIEDLHDLLWEKYSLKDATEVMQVCKDSEINQAIIGAGKMNRKNSNREYIHYVTGCPIKFIHNIPGRYSVGYTAVMAQNPATGRQQLLVTFATAWCSNGNKVRKPDRFDRKIARKVITGRMNYPKSDRNYGEQWFSGRMPTTGNEWRALESAIESVATGVINAEGDEVPALRSVGAL